MGLSPDLISQFTELTNNREKTKKETTVYGKIVDYGGKNYVQLDGSELLTPVITTVESKPGDRVTVLLKNHTATVTGNITSPAAQTETVKVIVKDIENVNEVLANVVTTEDLKADRARITKLEASDVTINNTLNAHEANIEKLQAADVTINGTLSANKASISELKAADAEINGTLTAQKASIEDLRTTKLSATDIEGKFANIDFSNIGKAAMEYFYSNSGLINNVTIGDGTITGNLVGVTISGDLIQGNTVKAEKLVIKGTDGLYYKLNTDGMKTEAEQTEQNSLDGSVITAKSITASKISVTDLVAFDATIGGFNITNSAIYSGVKETIDNTTNGVYMDKTGQMAIGDATNFIRYYKDQNGDYQLEISAQSVVMSVNATSEESKTVEAMLIEMQESTESAVTGSVEQFYQSGSPKSLTGGSWSVVQPTWTDGKYVWRRTKITYGDGSIAYSPSESGVCITGNTGAKGDTGPQGIQGEKGEKGDTGATGPRGLQGLQGPQGEQGIAGPKGDTGAQGVQGVKGDAGADGKTSYFHIKYSSVASPTSASQMTETPSTYIGTYVDFTQADSTDPSKYTWSRLEGAQGAKGDQGIAGTNGTNGKTSYLHIAYANSADGSTGFSVSDSSGKSYIGQYTDFTQTDSTNPTAYSWTKIKGETGATGAKGATGATGPQGPKGDTGAKGVGVSGVDVQYYKSTSATALSGGSWTTTNPGWENGKYIWSKTVVTYTDGTSENSTPVCITGAKGSTGATGATGSAGKGVTTIVEQYYQSTSSTSLSGGSWSSTYPGWVSGKYIWTRSVITYTDSSTTTTTAICVTGAKGSTGATGAKGDKGDTGATGAKGDKGDTGATGKGIKSIAEKYAISTSNTTAPSTWYDTVQVMTSTNKYLWNYEIITYTDNTTSTTSKRVIGAYGDKGATGATGSTGAAGKGITSITNYYLASTASSGVTTSTSGWSTTPSTTTTTNKYLWNYEKVTYTDSTTTTTTPHIIGTHGATGATGAKGATGATGAKGDKGDGLDIKDTRSDNQPPSWYFTNYPKTTVMEFKNCSAIGLSGVGTYCSLQTIVPWNDKSGGYPKQTAKVESTGKEYWRVGTSESAWSSWIDAYGKALEAAKTATNFMSFDSTNGLLVGNKSSGSWSGTRAQIKSNAFNILDSSGTVMASYGATTTIGKSSANNVYIDSDSIDIRKGTTVVATFDQYGLKIANTNDASGSLGSGTSKPALVIGTQTGYHIEMDNNEIMAKSDATTTSHLFLNMEGGNVSFNNNCDRALMIQDGAIYAKNKNYNSGNWLGVIDGLNESGNTTFGYGGYLQEIGATNIYGNAINLYSKGDVSTNHSFVVGNGSSFQGTNTSGALRNNLQPCNTNNNCVIGYGSYNAGEGATNIYGKTISLTYDDLKLNGTSYDSGWKTPSISSSLKNYDSNAVNALKYRRVGKIVDIRGAVSPANTSALANGNSVTAFTLPTGYRPSYTRTYIFQGSGLCIFMVQVQSGGAVTIARYRNVGSTSYPTSVATGTWLPISATFTID